MAENQFDFSAILIFENGGIQESLSAGSMMFLAKSLETTNTI